MKLINLFPMFQIANRSVNRTIISVLLQSCFIKESNLIIKPNPANFASNSSIYRLFNFVNTTALSGLVIKKLTAPKLGRTHDSESGSVTYYYAQKLIYLGTLQLCTQCWDAQILNLLSSLIYFFLYSLPENL